MPGLAELTSPGFVSRSAAFAAVAYYTLAYATQLLPVQAAAGLVVMGLVRVVGVTGSAAGARPFVCACMCCLGGGGAAEEKSAAAQFAWWHAVNIFAQ